MSEQQEYTAENDAGVYTAREAQTLMERAFDEGRKQGRRDAQGVDEHRHQRQTGLVCHSHGGVTHWHDNDGPAYTLHAANPYRTTPIPPGSSGEASESEASADE